MDLMSQSLNGELVQTGSFIIVNKMYVGRPDLVSLALYGDDMYADIICKINGISNPFELNENDIVFVPDKDYIMECCKVFDDENVNDFIEDEDEPVIYNQIDVTSKFQKKKDEKRAPHEQTKGEKNYVIDRSLGLIFY